MPTETGKGKVHRTTRLRPGQSFVNEDAAPYYGHKQPVTKRSRRSKIESKGIYHVMESADKIWRVMPEGSEQSIKNFKYQPKAIEYVQGLKGPVVNIKVYGQNKALRQLAPASLHVIAYGKRWHVVPKGQVRSVISFSKPGEAVRYAKKLQAPQTQIVLHNEDGEVKKIYK